MQLKTFDISKIESGSTVGIIAKRGSGKSYLVRDIVNKLNIPVVIIICPTDEMNDFYQTVVPGCYVYHKFDTSTLNDIFRRQELMMKKAKKYLEQKKKLDIRLLLIMDDCQAESKSWTSSDEMQKLFKNGRHYMVSFFLTIQYTMGIPPNMRTNFDYLFILADDNPQNIKKLYDGYVGIFQNVAEFRKYYQHFTKNYGCLVVNKKSVEGTLMDKVFFYKAENVQKRRSYGAHYEKYARDNYDPNWREKKIS